MTEEELRPIAENYVEEYCYCPDGEYTDGSLVCSGIGTALIVSRQLEKRISELEEKLEQTEKDLADYQFNYPTIKELQKENAELKMSLKVERKNKSNVFAELNDETAQSNEMLMMENAEAKEIIRELLSSCFGYNSKTVNYEVKAKAEAFLNSEVEK